MASITVRNLDDQVKHRLKIQAALNNRSMEEEVRHSLNQIYGDDHNRRQNLASALLELSTNTGGAELDIPSRTAIRTIDL